MKLLPGSAALLMLAFALNACSNGSVDETTVETEAAARTTAPEVSVKPDAASETTAKLSGPVTISYRIIGKPVVGQPVAIELQFASALDAQQIDVAYRINDATAMRFPESQPATVSMVLSVGEETGAQQVSVIPLREGRLYLNVSAQVETENGSMTSAIAIPIPVGNAPRELQSNGERVTDADGETVISLPAKED